VTNYRLHYVPSWHIMDNITAAVGTACFCFGLSFPQPQAHNAPAALSQSAATVIGLYEPDAAQVDEAKFAAVYKRFPAERPHRLRRKDDLFTLALKE
jgi:hypothetical protein